MNSRGIAGKRTLERNGWLVAVDEHQRGAVFEHAVRAPFAPHHARRKKRESRIAGRKLRSAGGAENGKVYDAKCRMPAKHTRAFHIDIPPDTRLHSLPYLRSPQIERTRFDFPVLVATGVGTDEDGGERASHSRRQQVEALVCADVVSG